MSSNPGHPYALPPGLSPDALDTITELHAILTRLRTTIQASNPAGGAAGSSLQPPGATPNVLGASPGGTGANSTTLREVSAQTDAIKHKLQRVKTEIKALPDMDRTLEEQEAEIKELQERIKLQKEVLEKLRDFGVKFAAENSKMDTE